MALLVRLKSTPPILFLPIVFRDPVLGEFRSNRRQLRQLFPHSRSRRIANVLVSLAKTAGLLILSSGGVVRGISNWGINTLPRVVKKHQATYHEGHYFLMRFDSSAKAQQQVKTTLGLDPRMIKFSIVRMGRTLEEIGKIEGNARYFS